MSDVKLLPCPFCGGEPKAEQKGRNGFRIKCKSCPAEMKQKTLRFSVEWLANEMVKDWNSRRTMLAPDTATPTEAGESS